MIEALNEALRIGAVVFVATSYCPCQRCCGHNSPMVGGHGLTASGLGPVEGFTIAADPRVLQFGTVVWIEGVGRRVVRDTGSDIVGNRIDVFKWSHEDALQFGRKRLLVYILGEENYEQTIKGQGVDARDRYHGKRHCSGAVNFPAVSFASYKKLAKVEAMGACRADQVFP